MMQSNFDDQPARLWPVKYTICIKGHLDVGWEEWFQGFSLSPTETGETIIFGPVRDQAALNGLLSQILGMNLILISVKRIEPG